MDCLVVTHVNIIRKRERGREGEKESEKREVDWLIVVLFKHPL